ncbi:hypothetical protein MNEG_11888 [Monoraphidium neglectum]|jgi:hypothetical protein|uniref:Uncharacterized protein n=1 Tax=Monoraphidium neglectum TaxID=145388 RepID=A0A0D2MMU6_9CHLO|nr:hypothetical protein MNEG_11888 [Monoraphidium neglectum]KIY96075.1 hypothetical protein MNEG_11888 [Monoraphidium neglectum]|eukprot:XP_013895095.1 hypothetical protein MNEG_11888 [Monoraphidium neglectum]
MLRRPPAVAASSRGCNVIGGPKHAGAAARWRDAAAPPVGTAAAGAAATAAAAALLIAGPLSPHAAAAGALQPLFPGGPEPIPRQTPPGSGPHNPLLRLPPPPPAAPAPLAPPAPGGGSAQGGDGEGGRQACPGDGPGGGGGGGGGAGEALGDQMRQLQKGLTKPC